MQPDARFICKPMYDIYECTIQMRDRLYGAVPKCEKSFHKVVAVRTKHDDEQTVQQVEELTEEMKDKSPEPSYVGFLRDEKEGLYVKANSVKAMLKQGASMLRITMDKTGSKQILREGMEVKGLVHPMRIYLDRQQPDDTVERPIQVSGPKGDRSALKKADYVERVMLTFHIWVLGTHPSETRHVGEKELIRILAFSQENGLGGDRSQGEGKFDVLKFEKIQTATLGPVKEPKDKKTKNDKQPNKTEGSDD